MIVGKQNPSTKTQLKGLIRLTRWQEYIPFVVPLTILGAILAARPHGIELDWRLATVTLANILAVAYAFMINDIEDAPDDALDPDRAARNPVTSGEINAHFGYTACGVVAIATLGLYATGGWNVFMIGVATLLLSHLYSWRMVRLKAYPVTDIVSHSLMLSGLLLLAGYFLYHNDPGIVWFVAACATLFSAYGQLYNQLRDYDMDKAAGLFNTAILLGEAKAKIMMYISIGLSGLCLLVAIFKDVFPVELGFAVILGIFLSSFIRGTTDARGSEAADLSGMLQVKGLVVINLTIASWLAWTLAEQLTLIS